MKLFDQLWLNIMNAVAAFTPAFYYLLLGLMAAAGYGFLLLFPLASVLLLAFPVLIAWQHPLPEWHTTDWILALCCLLISGLAAWTTFAIFRTRPDLPSGKPLTNEDFPSLVHRVDELSSTYNAPQIGYFRLTTRFAIELVSSPRNGFPFSFNYTLLIGLPVISSLSPLHFKLLLAREVGHLALARKRFRHRLVLLDSVWRQYADAYRRSWKIDTLLPRLFFSVFSRLYHISARPAERLEDFVKDRCILDIAQPQSAAEAIVLFEIRRRFLDRSFWTALHDMAYHEPRPAWLPYSRMSAYITEKLNSETTQGLYEELTSEMPDDHARHPPLSHRMRALEQEQEEFHAPEQSADDAASHFLGETLQEIQNQFDRIWFLQNKTDWTKRHKQGIEEQQQLQGLRKQASKGLLSTQEARRYLQLLEKYVPLDQALPLSYEILRTNSLDPDVCFDVGRILIGANDERGVEALKLAMELSGELTVPCCQLIIKYMVHSGDMRQAQIYRRMILAHQVEN